VANSIRILPDETVNKIAAGEVVERPASIVKELVENALDADSDRVNIEVWRGGRGRIRITDNGCGMSHDDALLSLERHATSKIREADDLNALRTLGFRGEAMPSIAAVTRMTLETRDHASPAGVRLDIEGGKIRQVSEIGRSQGTSVDIADLFFNTPARKKFLKGAETEWRHISQTVTALALANPQVAFTLAHDGRETLRATKGSLDDRVEALFRVRTGEDAISVSSGHAGLSTSGYVSSPEHSKRSGNQVLVINGRWVRHRGITQAVTDGYGGLLPKDTAPSFALCVDVDPGSVDVNVHPSKREVKFSDARDVYRAVADAVRAAVRQGGDIPEWNLQEATPIVIDTDVGLGDERVSRTTTEYGAPPTGTGVISNSVHGLREPLSLDDSQIALPLAIQEDASEVAPLEETPAPERPRFFQLHGSYILAQVKQGLIIVDQNLAHQRVLYEEAAARLEGDTRAPGQALLFPGTLEFGLTEIVTVREVMPYLEQIGFGIRDFGGNTVVVDAIPTGLEAWNEGELLRGIVTDLISDRTAHLDLGDRALTPAAHFLAVAYARRVAVPHGKLMHVKEMENLIDRLFACSEPYTSPTGRPTVSRFSLDDLARRFSQ